jgi:hypothetical protein
MRRGRALRRRYGHGGYNPGMNPFAPMPKVRFPGGSKLGDAGVPYEFNVKIMRLESDAPEDVYYQEVQDALADFEAAMHRKYPWLGSMYFSGRSGGWLTIEHPTGKMTKAKLEVIAKAVGAALARFKQHMVTEYPRA